MDGDDLVDFANKCPKLRELVCDDEETRPWTDPHPVYVEGGEGVGVRSHQQLETIRGIIRPRAREWQLANSLPESSAASASVVCAAATATPLLNQAAGLHGALLNLQNQAAEAGIELSLPPAALAAE